MSKRCAIMYIILGLILLSSCSVQRGGSLVERIRNGYYPYQVKNYVRPGYTEYGTASWYGGKFQGRRTADGEIYNMYAMTAAHKTLPFNTYVKVINLNNHRSAVVRINDRGPFIGNRIIDLSYVAAKKLGMIGTGTAPVKIIVLSNNTPIINRYSHNYSNSKENQSENIEPKADISPDSKDMQFSDTKSSIYYIQIGSFRQLSNAVKFRDKAARVVNGVHIIKVIISRKIFYRVVIGSFTTKNAALDYANRVVANKFENFYITDK